MLEEIQIEKFSCFEKQTNVKLSKINLLTGLNGSGKSEFLNAVMLVDDSFSSDTKTLSIKYVLDNEIISSLVKREGKSYKISFNQSEDTATLPSVKLVKKDRKLVDEFAFTNELVLNANKIANDILELNIDFNSDVAEKFAINWDFSSVAGSGFNSVLKIVLYALITRKDEILIIENPELNLHRKAQSRLIKFLVDICVKNNFQLFIETHSDHFINHIGKFIKVGDVLKDDALVLFFEGRKNQYNIEPCYFNSKGYIENWFI